MLHAAAMSPLTVQYSTVQYSTVLHAAAVSPSLVLTNPGTASRRGGQDNNNSQLYYLVGQVRNKEA